MGLLLRLLRITSPSEAAGFLAVSSLLLGLGVVKGLEVGPIGSVESALWVAWVALAAIYTGVGAAILAHTLNHAETIGAQQPRRGILWYGKFAFAIFATGMATVIIATVVVLMMPGKLVLPLSTPEMTRLFLAVGAVLWAPLVFSRLR